MHTSHSSASQRGRSAQSRDEFLRNDREPGITSQNVSACREGLDDVPPKCQIQRGMEAGAEVCRNVAKCRVDLVQEGGHEIHATFGVELRGVDGHVTTKTNGEFLGPVDSDREAPTIAEFTADGKRFGRAINDRKTLAELFRIESHGVNVTAGVRNDRHRRIHGLIAPDQALPHVWGNRLGEGCEPLLSETLVGDWVILVDSDPKGVKCRIHLCCHLSSSRPAAGGRVPRGSRRS